MVRQREGGMRHKKIDRDTWEIETESTEETMSESSDHEHASCMQQRHVIVGHGDYC